MSSVIARIKAVKQPRGGYIKPSMFESIQFDDDIVTLKVQKQTSDYPNT